MALQASTQPKASHNTSQSISTLNNDDGRQQYKSNILISQQEQMHIKINNDLQKKLDDMMESNNNLTNIVHDVQEELHQAKLTIVSLSERLIEQNPVVKKQKELIATITSQ